MRHPALTSLSFRAKLIAARRDTEPTAEERVARKWGRDKAGLTLAEAAARLGFARRQTVQEWEAGRGPKPATQAEVLAKIATWTPKRANAKKPKKKTATPKTKAKK